MSFRAFSDTEKLRIHAYLIQYFPNLTLSNYEPKSEATSRYNCVAMAADDYQRRWWPAPQSDPAWKQFYWPANVPREGKLEYFIKAFVEMGYEVCDSEDYEDGYEKVVIYVDAQGAPTHMARQLGPSLWCSKIGVGGWDIHHETPAVLNSISYGRVAQGMRRKSPKGRIGAK